MPQRYRDIYRHLETSLDRFIASATRSPASGEPVFAASLIAANSNRGQALLAPSSLQLSESMLARFAEMGLSGVTFDINFPILDPHFYAFTGQSTEGLERLTAAYRRLAEVARRHGLKVIVESSQIFASEAYSPVPVRGYYRSLDIGTFEARRLAMLKRIAEIMRPDWFTIIEEPDTLAQVTGLRLNDPDVLVPMVERAVRELKATVDPAPRIGAGYGTWHPRWRDFAVGFLRRSGVDFLNIHIYAVNDRLLTQAVESAHLARSHGKGIVIGEAWALKTLGREGIDSATDPAIFARDVYSFWAPLDTKFLSAMALLARSEGFAYLSPFWSNLLFGYIEYSPADERAPGGQATRRANQAAAENIRIGRLSPLGAAYSETIRTRR